MLKCNDFNIKHLKQYFIDLFILALPLFLGNLGHTLIGATDVFVVARYNINSLAAISIANSIIFTIFIFGIGIVTAVSIILSNLRGARQRIKKFLPSTLMFSLFLSIIFTLICYATKYFIPYMNFEEKLVPYIMEYITIVSFSMFGIFFFEGIKQFLQAYEIVAIPNAILIITVFVNLILDTVLVFGFGIIPEMSSRGAAIATLISRTFMGFCIFIYIYKFINTKYKIDFSYMRHVIKIGIPIGIALTLEFLAFNIITILIAQEAGILASVHSILITISSTTYMVPMAISTALSVKVSYYFGAKMPNEIKNYSKSALMAGLGFMICAGLILAVFPNQMIGIFTKDSSIIEIAMPIISVVAVYQVFDGLQCITGGILRGFKMTKTISICTLASYWLVGAPIAVILVYKFGYSLKGYWIALAVSLCALGIIEADIARKRFTYFKMNNI